MILTSSWPLAREGVGSEEHFLTSFNTPEPAPTGPNQIEPAASLGKRAIDARHHFAGLPFARAGIENDTGLGVAHGVGLPGFGARWTVRAGADGQREPRR